MTLVDLAPSIYIGHGSPMTVLDRKQYYHDLQMFSSNFKDLSAIVVVSAHWQQYIPIQITSGKIPGVIYDFYGFPEELYELEYNSPGNPTLALKIASELKKNNIEAVLNEHQGLDHGAWIPLKIMFPEEKIPVVQVSLPVPRNSDYLFKIGEILASLRSENTLIMGSGNLVHNIPYAMRQMQLGRVDMFSDANNTDSWAKETDEWIKERLDNKEITSLLQAPDKAPHFKTAAPTTEHFDPLYFVLGTMQESEGISYIHEGFQLGSFSMRSFSTAF